MTRRAATEPGDQFEDEATAVYTVADIKFSAAPPAARHVFVHMDGADVGRVVALSARSEFTIGRRPDCDLQLSYEGVSRRHARVFNQDGQYMIEDLGSANGTLVNGKAITKRALRDGDVLRFGPSVSVRYSVTDSKEEDLLRKMYEATVTDSLTGANNREYLDEQLRLEIASYQRQKTPFCLAMLDLDHFKNINDRFGHQAGDAVLIATVQAVRGCLAPDDILARFGGEEFAIILRGQDLARAAVTAEAVRRTCDCLVQYQGSSIPVSMSVGCASVVECVEPNVMTLIALADKRLYAAKHGGRNRVVAKG